MRPLKKKLTIAAAVANAAAIIGAVVLTALGSHAAKTQSYNYAADRWSSGGKTKYSQISCFFSPDANFDKNGVGGLRSMLLSELKSASVNPTEGVDLVPDAYSAPAGTAMVSGDASGHSDAEITAVGGDYFFLFRDFKLASGSFFSEKDLMQTGAVIDSQLAWDLYGSDEVTGMNIYINNVKLFISGVIETPSTKPEKRCAGKTPKAYISYYAAGLMFGASADQSGLSDTAVPEFRKITSYECIVPEPVENFAYSKIKKQLGDSYKGKLSIVNNAERFTPKKRVKALKKLGDSVVAKDGIIYPYWENASRMVEVRLSLIYGARRALLIIPLITALCLIIMGYRLFMRKKEGLKKAAADGVSAKWRSLKNHMPKKAEQTTEKES